MTLSVPSGSSTSPYSNIIGWGEVRHPTFVLQVTWTIRPGKIMQSFPFILITTFSCSWNGIRLRNAPILLISVILNAFSNYLLRKLTSLLSFAICLTELNPTNGWLIWSVVIKKGTSTWKLTPWSPKFNCITVKLLNGTFTWFPNCTLIQSGSSTIWLICFISASGWFYWI